ncbi:MAG: MFS transporter [Deltaproteobacteria bacterium]|nr:MFS transporter [Deltaproteobacteria bacterium]
MPQNTTPVTQDMQGSGWAWKVCVATLCRLALNTARRFAYPFAPALSRGMGVPLTAVTSIIAVNQSTAILGMFFGPLADRLGYRLMMLSGLGMLVLGMFAGGFLPFYGIVLAALFLAGMGKSVFDPAIQAYIGQRVPFHRRGLFIGLIEFSWAGSTLVGIPLAGLLIEYMGWRAPFFAVGGVGLIGMVGLMILLPKDGKKTIRHQSASGLLSAWRKLCQERAAMGALAFGFFASAANDNLFVVYGAWLENSFSLSIVALGLGTSVIGIAELSGEGLTAAISDRLGLKRSVASGMSLCIISYIALPLLGQTLSLSLGGLFLIFLTYEFTIVSTLSLCTELLPGLRATMMSGFLAAAGVGRVIGALMGGPVWLAGGILMTGAVSAVMSGLGLLCLIWGLRGWQWMEREETEEK